MKILDQALTAIEKVDLLLGGDVLFNELQEAYLLGRRQVAFKQRQKQLQESVIEKDASRDTDSYYDCLDDFQFILAYTRYRYVSVIGRLHLVTRIAFETSNFTMNLQL